MSRRKQTRRDAASAFTGAQGDVDMSVNLYTINNDTYEREMLGSVTESQLAFLVDNLEEDFEEDEEYFFSTETIQYLREMGADQDLLSLLEKAVSETEEGVDIFYAVE